MGESRFVTVEGHRIHALDGGNKGPPILLVHGLPANAYLWRNVSPVLEPHFRTVAVDLLGFGESDKPLDVTYDLPTQARHLAGVIQALGLEGCTLVGLDLGLLVALHYAMSEQSRAKALVMFEGFFMPVRQVLAQMPLLNRIAVWLARFDGLAERMMVKDPKAVEKMAQQFTQVRLPPEVLARYAKPFRDPAIRRRVWFEGLGPRAFVEGKPLTADTVACIDVLAAKLRQSSLPKLLLHATPGMATPTPIVEQARATLPGLKVKHVGPGKHFLPEDQPQAVAQAIVEFHSQL